MRFEEWRFDPDNSRYELDFYEEDDGVGLLARLYLPQHKLMREYNRDSDGIGMIKFIRGSFHIDGVFILIPFVPAKEIYQHFRDLYRVIVGYAAE